ncbi:hypothetical protein JB92DRAFT_2909886 [Gautieria morchelliformis]|nr:hypothetical protein JB92DRAFT_2909886 [Gautieria morchelliformis]
MAMAVFLLSHVLVRVFGSSGGDKWGPKVPLEKQIITYRAKDGTIKKISMAETRSAEGARESIGRPRNHCREQRAPTHA